MNSLIGNMRSVALCLLLFAGCSPQTEPIPVNPPEERTSTPSDPMGAEEPAGTLSANVPAVPTVDSPIRFRESSAELGLQFTRYNDFRGQHRILEANGGGCGVFDFDRDARPDVLFIDGCRYPELDDADVHHDVLFRGTSGAFVNVTDHSALQSTGYHTGCTAKDLNGDGFADLVIGAIDGLQLFWNNGDGTYSRDATAFTDLPASWTSSLACADFSDDGHLDLYVVNYVQDNMRHPKLCPRPESPDGYMQCSPTQYAAADDWLLLSDGVGGWRDVTSAAGITGVDGKGLGVVIADFNGDGRLDIYVANDGMPNFLYVRQAPRDESVAHADPEFADEALTLGCAVNASGVAESSMGIAAGDYDRDGDLDLHITNFYAEPNVLYENMAGNGFLDATIPSRLGSYSRSTMGWGTTFLDADNDGWLDLFVANGHVDDNMWAGNNEPYGIPPQFFWNRANKTFADVSRQCGATFTAPAFGRGVARCDLNRDGRLDVIMTDTQRPSQVLLNETSDSGHCIQLRLVGTGLGNRDAIGAKVVADGGESSQLQTLDGGGSFQSHNETLLHFGLGEATQCPRLTINWPDGTKSEFADVAADRSYLAVQGDEQLYLQP